MHAAVVMSLLIIAAPACADTDSDLHPLFERHNDLINLLQKKIIRLDTSEARSTDTHNFTAEDAAPVTAQSAIDPQAAERALERALTRSGALLLPSGQAELQFSGTYASSQQHTPLLYLHDGQSALALRETRRTDINTAMTARLGLPFDAQLEVTVPYRRVTQSIVTSSDLDGQNEVRANASAVGDISAGFAKTLLHERDGYADVIGRVSTNFGNGREQKNSIALGEGFKKIRGQLTMLKRLDPLVFSGDLSYEVSLASSVQSGANKNTIKPGDQIGLSLAALLATSPDTSLSLGLDQAWSKKTRVDGVGIAGSDRFSAMLVVGATAIVGKSTVIAVSVGKGMTRGTPDYFVNVAVPLRFDLFK